MKKMEQVKVTPKPYFINRYEVHKSESPYEFMEEADFGGGNGDKNTLLGFFNTNNTGTRMFRKNFLDFPEVAYESVEQIEEQAKELNLPHWAVVSFFAENGWDGVYLRTGKDALNIKCNNWVSGGSDGFYYVIFAYKEQYIQDFETMLQEWINHGSTIFEIYDNKTGDYTEESITSLSNYKTFEEWKNEMKEKYGFEDNDFLL